MDNLWISRRTKKKRNKRKNLYDILLINIYIKKNTRKREKKNLKTTKKFFIDN